MLGPPGKEFTEYEGPIAFLTCALWNRDHAIASVQISDTAPFEYTPLNDTALSPDPTVRVLSIQSVFRGVWKVASVSLTTFTSYIFILPRVLLEKLHYQC